MTKRLASKYKLNRRLGLNLWGRPKSPVNRREYGPGQHGARRSKLSGYGLQLSAKQRLRGYYGNIVEKQFRRYYREAVRLRGDSSQHLVGLLESRLDAIVYRAKFASTVFAARQLVSHGHVQVNGKRTNVASTLVKVGSEVALSPKASELAMVLEATAMQERDIPDYIEVDHKKMRAKYLKTPTLEDIPYPVKMEPNLVVEYYSR